jgi:phage tail-like protein
MPKVGDIWESYLADEYVVTIDGTPLYGVSKVSGLTFFTLDAIEQPMGGTGHIHKIASHTVKFDPLTIERYVDGSPDDAFFVNWWKQTYSIDNAVQGGSSVRKSGLITKLHNGEEVLKIAFYKAWISTASFTDLEAGATSHLKMTVELQHEGIEIVEMK